MNKVLIYIGFFMGIIFLSACSGNSDPGYEFMPNMYRSPSLETYGENNINGMNARMPIEGTIARGKLLAFNDDITLETSKKVKGKKEKKIEEIIISSKEIKETKIIIKI